MTAALRVDPQRGLVRGVRAAVLALPAVGVAALAHRSVDRCLDVPGTLLALGACWSGAVAVLGARRRLPALLGWLVAAQVVTHLALQATCATPGPLVPGARPLAAHLAAVVVLALALHRADAGLWLADGLLRAVRRLLAPTRPVPPLVPGAAPLPATAAPWRLPSAVPRTSVARRGPPSSALA